MKLWDEAVKWDSRRFRLEQADDFGDSLCETCVGGWHRRIIHLQLGHYFDRRHHAVYFDPVNRAIQCPTCNKIMNMDDHPQHEEIKGRFKRVIIMRDGHAKLARLEVVHRQIRKYTAGELKEMIQGFKTDVKRLLNEKGIQKWW